MASSRSPFSAPRSPRKLRRRPPNVFPPAGIAIDDSARRELTTGAAALHNEIEALGIELARAKNNRLLALLPDVEIFHKAVDWPLRYDQFFDAKQVDVARHLLTVGRERAAQLRAGAAPWLEATGTIIRGHRSKLDASVQPYALVVPPDWKRNDGIARRLDVVLLGRGEKRTELAFIAEREKSQGEIVPPRAIVLTPYGRYCNATKFAGEVDVFEAMDAVRHDYTIDPARIVVRGFSMGGASTWHLATHFPGLWCVAAPGAGFAETAAYTKAFAPGKPERTEWEQKLWRWYDATGYAANLINLPTVAYSGELDPQKQAADIMEKAMAAEGLKLEHLIGPQTAHKYHPETKVTLAARLDEIVAKGRTALPTEDHFTTYTLRYSSSTRIKIMELEQPWERADVHVRFPAPDELDVTTRNVAVFTIRLESSPRVNAVVDGQSVALETIDPDGWFVKEAGKWSFKNAESASTRWRTHARKVPDSAARSTTRSWSRFSSSDQPASR